MAVLGTTAQSIFSFSESRRYVDPSGRLRGADSDGSLTLLCASFEGLAEGLQGSPGVADGAVLWPGGGGTMLWGIQARFRRPAAATVSVGLRSTCPTAIFQGVQ
jgi:hypothetical protein